MIKKVSYDRERPGLVYDGRSRKWTGFMVDIRINGKRPRPVFGKLADAEDFYAEVINARKYKSAGVKAPTSSLSKAITLSVLRDRFLLTLGRKRQILARRVFDEFIRMHSDLRVTEIGRVHYQLYRNKRLESIKPSTVNREMTEIASALGKANELFPRELSGYESPPTARAKVDRRRIAKHVITKEEMLAITASIRDGRNLHEKPERAESRASIALFFELLWYLGLRFGEAVKIEKSRFFPEQRMLSVDRFKTSDLTEFSYLPKRVIEIIHEASAMSDTEYVFQFKCSETTMQHTLRDACEANGITYGRGKMNGITFHSNRHSFTTRLVQKTDIGTAKAFTSHSDEELVAYYSHATEASKKKAMDDMYNETNLRQLYDQIRQGDLDFQAFERLFHR